MRAMYHIAAPRPRQHGVGHQAEDHGDIVYFRKHGLERGSGGEKQKVHPAAPHVVHQGRQGGHVPLGVSHLQVEVAPLPKPRLVQGPTEPPQGLLHGGGLHVVQEIKLKAPPRRGRRSPLGPIHRDLQRPAFAVDQRRPPDHLEGKIPGVPKPRCHLAVQGQCQGHNVLHGDVPGVEPLHDVSRQAPLDAPHIHIVGPEPRKGSPPRVHGGIPQHGDPRPLRRLDHGVKGGLHRVIPSDDQGLDPSRNQGRRSLIHRRRVVHGDHIELYSQGCTDLSGHAVTRLRAGLRRIHHRADAL